MSERPGNQLRQQTWLKPIVRLVTVTFLSAIPQVSLSWDYDLRGYLGYAFVETSEDVDCNNRACQGVLENTLFYGLSAIAQGDHLGAQLIVSQDLEEEPDITIAQATWRQPLLNKDMDLRLRAGKIVVPLGLFGSQRITPATQPGLALPQPFMLNAYYDLLTLSENGVGVDLRGYTWGFKAAIYEPQEESVQRVIQIPATDGPLDFLLADLLGLDLLSGIGGTPPQTIVVTEKQSNKAGYLGIDYRDEDYLFDFGWIRQELNDLEVDAFNAGIQTTIGQFQPSIEAFQLDIDGLNGGFEGVSINLLYSAESWQAFVSGANIDIGRSTSQELVVGGVYYWDADGRISTRANMHRLSGDFVDSTSGIKDVTAYAVALSYSWD